MTEILSDEEIQKIWDGIKENSKEPLSSDAVLGDDFVFMAVEWLNNKPIIDGSKVFKDKIKCIEYIQNIPKIDGLEWTIARLEIVA